MDPGILLAQADVVIQVGVQPGAGDRATEGLFMQRGGASADHNTVDAQFLDVLLDLGLPGVRAERHIGARNDHIRLVPHHFGNLLTLDRVADVATAITGVDADLDFLRHIPPHHQWFVSSCTANRMQYNRIPNKLC